MKSHQKSARSARFAPATALALAAGVFSIGDASADMKPQGKLNVEMYGIITRALLYADDGDKHQLFNVDGGSENTRLGFAVTGKLSENWDVGGVLENNLANSNPTSSATLGANGEQTTDTTTFGIRIAEIALRHKSAGTFTLGQGNAASVDRVAVDLSGSALGLTAAAGDLAGGINFYNKLTGARAVTIADVFDKMDGLDKVDRLRYDTPEFNGFSAAVSYVDTGGFDFGAGWAGKFGEVEVEAAGYYANNSAGSTTEKGRYGGSVSAKHSSGFSLTVASAMREAKATGTDDAKYYWGKLGYSAALSSLGATHFGVTYGKFENLAQNGDEAKEIGVGLVQDLESIGSNFWFTARQHELDRTGSSFDDVFIISAGLLFNF